MIVIYCVWLLFAIGKRYEYFYVLFIDIVCNSMLKSLLGSKQIHFTTLHKFSKCIITIIKAVANVSNTIFPWHKIRSVA